MKKISRLLICVIMSCFASASATAADAPATTVKNYHLCTESELHGKVWRLLMLREQPAKKEAALYKRFSKRYIEFYTDHRLTFFVAPKEAKPVDLQKIFQAELNLPKAIYYTVDDKGELDLSVDKTPVLTMRCAIIDNDSQGYKKGDLTLSSNTKQNTQVYQLYRRYY